MFHLFNELLSLVLSFYLIKLKLFIVHWALRRLIVGDKYVAFLLAPHLSSFSLEVKILGL